MAIPESKASLSQILNDAFQLQLNGRLPDAERLYSAIIAVEPSHYDALHMLGVIKFAQGQFEDAHRFLVDAMRAEAPSPEILLNYGLVLNALERRENAIAAFTQALSLNPRLSAAYVNRAAVHFLLHRFEEALSDCDRALRENPTDLKLHHIQSDSLLHLGRNREALDVLDRALALYPRDPVAVFARSNALRGLGRIEEALSSLEQVIALQPNYFEALRNSGHALLELGQYEQAVERYKGALDVKPSDADTNFQCGVALHKLMRLSEALSFYDRVLALQVDHAAAWNHRGAALQMLGDAQAALAAYDRAIQIVPDDADVLNNRANALHELKRLDEAFETYSHAVQIDLDHPYAVSGLAICSSKLCFWNERDRIKARIESQIASNSGIVPPFVLLGYSDDPFVQHEGAKHYATTKFTAAAAPALWNREIWRHERLRIAYLSADFHSHATAHLITELIETHDRSRFQVLGISWGPNDHSDERKRLAAAFDEFRDVKNCTDRQIARTVRDQEIDILIDLKGYTHNERAGILACRPAPIQVSYLGYPGSMGTPLVDYIIADSVVVPFEHRDAYSEKIVYLPECYQVNDSKRKIADITITREDAGLPATGFVFCSFNACWKITPEVFDIWMRLLSRVPGSILWLLAEPETARRNLRDEAKRRGIDADRLVFAQRAPAALHLARQRLGDLFLDTLPCNAHTTASDALWAGLPILTCRGNAFAGRVAASLLYAAGVPELIVSNADEYESLALKLAHDARLLARTRATLQSKLPSCPLFDLPRFRQHIEAAYLTMWENWQSGATPMHFSVMPREEQVRGGQFGGSLRSKRTR